MSSISIASPIPVRLRGDAVGPAHRDSARGATRLRLTTRGRRVMLAIAATPLAVGIAFSVLAGGSALASGETAVPISFETVTVMPGDTLWSLATTIAPAADPRDVVDDIIRLNNLPGGTIQVGSELSIPLAYAD